VEAQARAARNKNDKKTGDKKGKGLKAFFLGPLTVIGSLLLFRLGLDIFAQRKMEQYEARKRDKGQEATEQERR